MTARVTPMLHVPDVRAAASWYRETGFDLLAWHACDSEEIGEGVPPDDDAAWDWALLGFGAGRFMLNAGGAASEARRREADLYVDLDPGGSETVDSLHLRLRDRVDVVRPPYDAFHGHRELIVRDPNGFWVTFAEPVES